MTNPRWLLRINFALRARTRLNHLLAFSVTPSLGLKAAAERQPVDYFAHLFTIQAREIINDQRRRVPITYNA
jgi:hypothetical protein